MWEPLDRVIPPESRGRRVVAWGVVAWTGVGIALVLWLVAQVFKRVGAIFPYLAVAGLVVLVLNPLVKLLVRARVPRRLAATIVFLAAAIATPLLLNVIVTTLVDQGNSLIQNTPKLVGEGGAFAKLAHSHNSMLHDIGTSVLRWIHHHHVGTREVLHRLGNGAVQLAHFGFVLLFGSLIGYVALLSLPEIGKGSMALVPMARRNDATEFVAELGRVLSGYVRSRLIVSAVVGLLATVGLWAIHMPFWLILGLVVGVANLIPVLGSWIGGLPVVFVALLTKPPAFLLAALAVMVVAHLVDGWILSPIVLKETLSLHPVVTLLSVIVGAELLGFWGVLIAVPIAGIVQYLLSRALRPYRAQNERAETAPQPAPA